MSNLPDFSIIDDKRSGLDNRKLTILEEKLKIQAEPTDKWFQNDGLHMKSREVEEAVKDGIAKQKAKCIYALRQHRFCVSDFFDTTARSEVVRQAKLGTIVTSVGMARQGWAKFRSNTFELDFVRPVQVHYNKIAHNLEKFFSQKFYRIKLRRHN